MEKFLTSFSFSEGKKVCGSLKSDWIDYWNGNGRDRDE